MMMMMINAATGLSCSASVVYCHIWSQLKDIHMSLFSGTRLASPALHPARSS